MSVFCFCCCFYVPQQRGSSTNMKKTAAQTAPKAAQTFSLGHHFLPDFGPPPKWPTKVTTFGPLQFLPLLAQTTFGPRRVVHQRAPKAGGPEGWVNNNNNRLRQVCVNVFCTCDHLWLRLAGSRRLHAEPRGGDDSDGSAPCCGMSG